MQIRTRTNVCLFPEAPSPALFKHLATGLLDRLLLFFSSTMFHSIFCEQVGTSRGDKR